MHRSNKEYTNTFTLMKHKRLRHVHEQWHHDYLQCNTVITSKYINLENAWGNGTRGHADFTKDEAAISVNQCFLTFLGLLYLKEA